MEDVVGAIISDNNIVIISSSQNSPLHNTAIYNVTPNCVVGVLRNKTKAKKFLDEFILSKSPKTLKDTLTLIIDQLKLHKEYVDAGFLIFGFLDEIPIAYTILISDGEIKSNKTDTLILTTPIDLMEYITSKVFSTQMNVKELTDLLVFIILQHSKILKIDFLFDIVRIDANGIERLTKKEITQIFYLQNKKINTLKKLFSNFFIQEESKK